MYKELYPKGQFLFGTTRGVSLFEALLLLLLLKSFYLYNPSRYLTVETRQANPICYRLPSNRASDDDDDDDDDPKIFFKSVKIRVFSK